MDPGDISFAVCCKADYCSTSRAKKQATAAGAQVERYHASLSLDQTVSEHHSRSCHAFVGLSVDDLLLTGVRGWRRTPRRFGGRTVGSWGRRRRVLLQPHRLSLRTLSLRRLPDICRT